MTPPSMHQTAAGPSPAEADNRVSMELPVSNTARVRVAIFNPIFAHYRSALIRELRRSTIADYRFLADTQDGDSRIPAVEFGRSSDFIRSPVTRVFGRIAWQPQALRAAISGEYDCFVFTGDASWLSTWIAAAAARLRGRRVLFWTHGWIRHDRGIRKYVRLAFYGLADGLLLYGERAARIGVDLGYRANRMHVIFNSLDYDAQQAMAATIGHCATADLRTRLFGDPDTPVVIATARLTAVKRFDLLIEALVAVNRDVRAVNLLVVGDGPERNRLESLAAGAGVKAAFVGACYDEATLAAYFLASNVTISPGNVGLTCMHSLGYGVPVITHDDPNEQMPEWEAIEVGVTGDVFRKNSVEDLAAKIERWTRTPLPSQSTRERCHASIARRYHPRAQAAAIDTAVLPASDLARRGCIRDR
jgi:glycosyltransferase involved in cell wall biosynthesis